MDVLSVAPTAAGWAIRLGNDVVSVMPSRSKAEGRADWLSRELRRVGAEVAVVADGRDEPESA